MKVRLLAAARQELDDAIAWYDDQAPGLGREFLDEIDRAVRRPAVHVEGEHPRGGGVLTLIDV